jgi:hypothetical protein
MALQRRDMSVDFDFKEVQTVKPLSQKAALAVIELCRDPVFKNFALDIYTKIYDNFQPRNAHLLIGFRQAATRSPIFMIKNAQGPVNGFELGSIMSPPGGIKASFPTITTNIDGTLNIEIKYDLPDFAPPRAPSPPPVTTVRARDKASRSRSHSQSPPRKGRSKYSPERPLRTKDSSSSSGEGTKGRGRGIRRSASVARETKPPPRGTSRSRGRSAGRKKKSSSSEAEEVKKPGLFTFW